MAVRQEHLRALAPYLESTGPNSEGEWGLHCPLHEDAVRSASLNVQSSEWWCNVCSEGGSVVELIKRREDWLESPGSGTQPESIEQLSARTTRREAVTEAHVQGWAATLLEDEAALEWMLEHRGLTNDTLRRFQIGWDPKRRVYTIPIRDFEGTLINLRRYDPRPRDDRRKIWQVAGMVSKALYPISALIEARQNGGRIIVDEGEWDTLRLLQEGYYAVTRTGTADLWLPQWSRLFEGMDVYVGHDADIKGEQANRKVARAVAPFANTVRKLKLPFEQRKKHGQDWTDYWFLYDHEHFESLLSTAPALRRQGQTTSELPTITVLESFDSRNVARPVRLLVTIKGKREPGYTVPARAMLSCDRMAGQKCSICPMNDTPGEATLEIKPNDPLVLELLESSNHQMYEIIRRSYGAQKCNRLAIEPDGHQAVEQLWARPSIDITSEGEGSDYKNIKITSVGRHDTLPNKTVAITGALFPNPRTQANEFQAWEVERQVTSIDHFDLDDETLNMLRLFQTNTHPLRKLASIAKQLSAHVTRIYGRPEMHALMMLTWHSVNSFKFSGEVVARGWLETLVVGDTQQGKSETARSLARHYQAGEVVNCEAATFAGIVGGLQQFGSGREWAVTWGAVPLNDRRLVVLEEASGLTTDQISQMSDIRSSGIAKLVKIQTEETYSRTRLLWIANPRNARMSDYTYGVQAIRPLIGNNEDIARFDLAMSVALGEVAPEQMNKPHGAGALQYPSEACAALVRWAWTRTADQVRWALGAEEEVYSEALRLGAIYVEDPPLVQAANIRLKIARVAVALAAATFNCDETSELLIIEPQHVTDAVMFIERLYGMRGFGYAERSREILSDHADAEQHRDDVKAYLVGRKGLAKFLRNVSSFRGRDLEETMNLSREEANAVINTLWNSRMVRRDGPEVRAEPTLQELLREVKL